MQNSILLFFAFFIFRKPLTLGENKAAEDLKFMGCFFFSLVYIALYPCGEKNIECMCVT